MVPNLRSLALSVAVVLAFSACGGGGSSSGIPASGPVTGQVGPAAIQLFVPSSISSARRAKVLPSSTQSVQIDVTSGTATPLASPVPPATFNVTAGTGGCQSVTGGISCTETVTVPFGASLLFSIIAYAGQNATGAALAQGSATATIGSATQNVAVTMNAQNLYIGASLEGGIGEINIDHAAGTFTVNESNGPSISGTEAALPNNPDFVKLVSTSPTNGNATQGDIVYARELAGSMLLFGDTGSTTVPPTGSSGSSGGDMGAGVAAQGCPGTAGSVAVSIADVPGPAWVTTSPTYTSGTAAITVSSGTATLNFTGNEYDSGSNTGNAQSGTQVCSGGVFSAANQGSVAFSPNGVTVVTRGSNAGSVSATDVKEGGFGFSEQTPPTATAALTGVYDGFIGGFTLNGQTITKNESPVQVTPSTPSQMMGCLYSNFEAGTVGSTCATINVGSATNQPGVYLATIVIGPNSSPGAIVLGTTTSGKYAIFGTFGNPGSSGGQYVELIQH